MTKDPQLLKLASIVALMSKAKNAYTDRAIKNGTQTLLLHNKAQRVINSSTTALKTAVGVPLGIYAGSKLIDSPKVLKHILNPISQFNPRLGVYAADTLMAGATGLTGGAASALVDASKVDRLIQKGVQKFYNKKLITAVQQDVAQQIHKDKVLGGKMLGAAAVGGIGSQLLTT